MRQPGVLRCAALAASLLVLPGCFASLRPPMPYVGTGPNPQIVRGQQIPPLDFTAEVLSLPFKLILWNWNFNSHTFSPETEKHLVEFLDRRNKPAFEQTTYRVNQYAPISDLKALAHNKRIFWPVRLVFGLPLTLIYDVVLPGRILPLGDYFNPYTNTVHIYSDDLAITLHESGHAYDFADFPHPTLYALIRTLPFTDLYQEWWASDHAIDYLIETNQRDEELRAYKVLWPAYGTYAGSYFPVPFASWIGAGVGHVLGRVKSHERRKFYERMDAVLHPTSSAGKP